MVSNNFYKGKPKLSANSKYSQGFYRPLNPDKYIGDSHNIVFRSGLEQKWYKYFDLSPAIIGWKCEETVIPYLNPIDNKRHKYFVDVYIKYKTKTGEIKESLVEIKPFKEVQVPVKAKMKMKSFIYQVQTYIVNEAKWNAAKAIAVNNNMDFKILTETGFVEWVITK